MKTLKEKGHRMDKNTLQYLQWSLCDHEPVNLKKYYI